MTCEFKSKFKLIKFLRKGTVSEIFKCADRITGQHFACKIIKGSRNNRRFLNYELPNASLCNYKHIYKIHDYFYDKTNEEAHIVTELGNGDMMDYIETYNLNIYEKINIIEQMTRAINYIQTKGIYHGDVKLENFIYRKNIRSDSIDIDYIPEYSKNDNTVKLIDFEFSRKYDKTLETENIFKGVRGSPSYIAPELLIQKKYNYLADNWSLGVCVYVILTNTFPINPTMGIRNINQRHRYVKQTYNVNYNPNIWNSLPVESHDFVKGLLENDPTKRRSITDCLKHDLLSTV
jgi:serine/threonine protein kinase